MLFRSGISQYAGLANASAAGRQLFKFGFSGGSGCFEIILSDENAKEKENGCPFSFFYAFVYEIVIKFIFFLLIVKK